MPCCSSCSHLQALLRRQRSDAPLADAADRWSTTLQSKYLDAVWGGFVRKVWEKDGFVGRPKMELPAHSCVVDGGHGLVVVPTGK